MRVFSHDDTSTVKILPTFNENVDYMSESYNLDNNYNLYQCWKQNNSMSIKSNNDDISWIIPSTISIRLENICWRRWYKNLNDLREISPDNINWSKDQDITWLYGPKFNNSIDFEVAHASQLTESNLSKVDPISIPVAQSEDIDDGYLSSSISSEISSLSFTESINTSNTAEALDFDHSLKPVLKKSNSRTTKKTKNVKFNFIINSREFINGMSIDYDFLDKECL